MTSIGCVRSRWFVEKSTEVNGLQNWHYRRIRVQNQYWELSNVHEPSVSLIELLYACSIERHRMPGISISLCAAEKCGCGARFVRNLCNAINTSSQDTLLLHWKWAMPWVKWLGLEAKKPYGSFPLNFDAILTFGNAATLIYFPFHHSPTCSILQWHAVNVWRHRSYYCNVKWRRWWINQ